jgi:hypothetical protein
MYNTLDPIGDWYNSDEKVKNIIDRLSSSGMTNEEQAAAAFEEMSDAFDLPKYGHNFTDAHYAHYEELGMDTPRSVFEEAAIIRYLEPDDDPRGVVMLAIYHVYNGIQVPMEECAEKHFGGKGKIPQQYMVCFLGENVDGKLHFLDQGESWMELGARSAMQIIRR